MLYTAPKRFTKSLAEWCRADSTLVTLSGHTAQNLNIRLYSGDNQLKHPGLTIDVVSMDPWLLDVDHIFISRVFFICCDTTRIKALDMMGAMAKLVMQNPSTQADASFDLNSIRTKGIQLDVVDPFGESLFEATSIRRTERSDVPIPGLFVAIVSALIRWEDYGT